MSLYKIHYLFQNRSKNRQRKQPRNMRNKIVQLVVQLVQQHCCIGSYKVMLLVLSPTSQVVMQQI